MFSEQTKMTSDIQEQATAAIRLCHEQSEVALIGQLELIEGRVPTDDEIAKYARVGRLNTPLGVRLDFCWKGKPVVTSEVVYNPETISIDIRVKVATPCDIVVDDD